MLFIRQSAEERVSGPNTEETREGEITNARKSVKFRHKLQKFSNVPGEAAKRLSRQIS